jgi:GTP cyclohydrolase I
MSQESIIAECFTRLMTEGLGLDLKDPNLSGTPQRVAKMYRRELFSGLYEEPPIITTFPNSESYDEIIMMDNIPFVSVCSHHFLPFQGLAWFIYIPQDHIESDLSGASKIARVINHFASRPQLQERLTQQTVKYFVEKVNPLGAMLVMRAVHGCMSCRGVKTGNRTGMTTSKVQGCFKENPTTRREALELINMSIKLAGG